MSIQYWGRRNSASHFRILTLILIAVLAVSAAAKAAEGGSLVWVKRAGGSAYDTASGIALLGDGTALVTGTFQSAAVFGPDETNETTLTSAGDHDIFVARYDLDGTLVWATRAGAAGEGTEWGRGIAGLDDGSVLVAGDFVGTATFGPGDENETTLTSAGGAEVFVAKYNPDGTLAWAKRAGGAGEDHGQDLAAFPDGSFVITGYFTGSTTFGSGEGNETTLTSVGGQDIFVARFNADGTLEWLKGAGGTGEDDSRGVASLVDGSSFVTGYFNGMVTFASGEVNETTMTSLGDRDICVARYSANGTLSWVTRAGGSGHDYATAIASFGSGHTIVTGGFNGSAIFGSGEANETYVTCVGLLDIFVGKFNPDGSLLWATRAGDSDIEFGDKGWGIASLSDGGGVVTGLFDGTATFGASEENETTLSAAGINDMFIAAYNAEGTLAWARRAGGSDYDMGCDVAVSSDGRIWAAGYFKSAATFGPGEANETILSTIGGFPEVFVGMFSSGMDVGGEGEGEGEGNCEAACEGTSGCSYECLFGCGWAGFAEDCSVDDDGGGGGQRIPLRWGLGMVRAVLCNPGHPHHDGTLADYEANLAIIEGSAECQEEPAVQAMVWPYRHSLAALLLVSSVVQNRVEACLGLECDYVVYHVNAKTIDEPFSDDGDLDGDGVTNADEYDNVIPWGGSIDDFVSAAMQSWWSGEELPAATRPSLALLAVLLLLALAAAGLRAGATRNR